MKYILLPALIVMMSLSLFACGETGPLYLPKDDQPSSTQTPASDQAPVPATSQAKT